jgi:hypothetical protein
LHPSWILAPLILFSTLALPAADWKPVDPADLAAKTPKLDPAADAEALFWEVWVLDELDGGYPHTVLSNYLRIKIFTERGKERLSKVDIVSAGKRKINEIAARTIKPDGTVLEVGRDSIFDRNIARADGLSVKAKSFAMPGVEPGAIIEYRWRETREDEIANYVRLPFQREIPVQNVIYHIKPLSHPFFPFGMRSVSFHIPSTSFTKESNGYLRTTLANVPALREEPYMPPLDQVRAWMLIYYSKDTKLNPDKYWPEFGKATYREWKPLIKVDNQIRSTAAELVGKASSDDDKLRLLYLYCRNSIKNTHDRGAGLSAEDRADLKKNRAPSDTLAQRAGSPSDIKLLFASLATAAGFDARVANLADRSDMFDRNFPDPYFLNSFNIAVHANGQWRFFDPGQTYAPYGMLRWQEEGQDALVSDPKEPVFVRTPLAGPEKSRIERKGTFTLDTDGNLDGDVTMAYTGHEAQTRRSQAAGETEEQFLGTLRRAVKGRISTAVISKAKLENAKDPDQPLVHTFHVRVPGYAQRTGKRIFVPIAFFEKGNKPRFESSTRTLPVVFHHPWSEEDNVVIQIPEGFDLESPEAPMSVPFTPVGEYRVRALINKAKRQLIYTRTFSFGGEGRIFFDAPVYPSLKKIFDAIHEQDDRMITLRQGEAAN